MNESHITVAFGDGIGPELMHATLRVMKEAAAELSIETIEVGKMAYRIGNLGGVYESGLETIARHPILFKAPTHAPLEPDHTDVTTTILNAFPAWAKLAPSATGYALEWLTEDENAHEHAQKKLAALLGDATVNEGAAEADWQMFVGEDLVLIETAQAALPAIAERDMADARPMLNAAIALLNMLGQPEPASRIERAMEKVEVSIETDGLDAYTDALIDELWT